MRQRPLTAAMRTGARQLAPPSIEREDAIARPSTCQRYTTATSPFGRMAGKTPTPARAPMSTGSDHVTPPSSEVVTASMSRSAECVYTR